MQNIGKNRDVPIHAASRKIVVARLACKALLSEATAFTNIVGVWPRSGDFEENAIAENALSE